MRDREKILFQGPLEIFFNQERLKNFSVKVRLKYFLQGPAGKSPVRPPVPAEGPEVGRVSLVEVQPPNGGLEGAPT